MITKGNNTKVQNEVIAQTITDETAKRLKRTLIIILTSDKI